MLIKDFDALGNILDAVEKIEKYSKLIKNADELFDDDKTFDAVLMNFVVIGEMASKLSEGFKISNPELDWWKIKGLRNIVAHDYFGVDAEEIWQIIQNNIPELKIFTQNILKQNTDGKY